MDRKILGLTFLIIFTAVCSLAVFNSDASVADVPSGYADLMEDSEFGIIVDADDDQVLQLMREYAGLLPETVADSMPGMKYLRTEDVDWNGLYGAVGMSDRSHVNAQGLLCTHMDISGTSDASRILDFAVAGKIITVYQINAEQHSDTTSFLFGIKAIYTDSEVKSFSLSLDYDVAVDDSLVTGLAHDLLLIPEGMTLADAESIIKGTNGTLNKQMHQVITDSVIRTSDAGLTVYPSGSESYDLFVIEPGAMSGIGTQSDTGKNTLNSIFGYRFAESVLDNSGLFISEEHYRSLLAFLDRASDRLMSEKSMDVFYVRGEVEYNTSLKQSVIDGIPALDYIDGPDFKTVEPYSISYEGLPDSDKVRITEVRGMEEPVSIHGHPVQPHFMKYGTAGFLYELDTHAGTAIIIGIQEGVQDAVLNSIVSCDGAEYKLIGAVMLDAAKFDSLTVKSEDLSLTMNDCKIRVLDINCSLSLNRTYVDELRVYSFSLPTADAASTVRCLSVFSKMQIHGISYSGLEKLLLSQYVDFDGDVTSELYTGVYGKCSIGGFEGTCGQKDGSRYILATGITPNAESLQLSDDVVVDGISYKVDLNGFRFDNDVGKLIVGNFDINSRHLLIEGVSVGGVEYRYNDVGIIEFKNCIIGLFDFCYNNSTTILDNCRIDTYDLGANSYFNAPSLKNGTTVRCYVFYEKESEYNSERVSIDYAGLEEVRFDDVSNFYGIVLSPTYTGTIGKTVTIDGQEYLVGLSGGKTCLYLTKVSPVDHILDFTNMTEYDGEMCTVYVRDCIISGTFQHTLNLDTSHANIKLIDCTLPELFLNLQDSQVSMKGTVIDSLSIKLEYHYEVNLDVDASSSVHNLDIFGYGDFTQDIAWPGLINIEVSTDVDFTGTVRSDGYEQKLGSEVTIDGHLFTYGCIDGQYCLIFKELSADSGDVVVKDSYTPVPGGESYPVYILGEFRVQNRTLNSLTIDAGSLYVTDCVIGTLSTSSYNIYLEGSTFGTVNCIVDFSSHLYNNGGNKVELVRISGGVDDDFYCSDWTGVKKVELVGNVSYRGPEAVPGLDWADGEEFAYKGLIYRKCIGGNNGAFCIDRADSGDVTIVDNVPYNGINHPVMYGSYLTLNLDCENLFFETIPKNLKINGSFVKVTFNNADPVSISNPLFGNNTVISEMIFNGCIVEIGRWVYHDQSIGNITFNGTVNKLGEYSFSRCVNLHGITFNGDVDDIAPNAFECCSVLEVLIFNGHVGKLCSDSFRECTNIRQLEFNSTSGTLESAFNQLGRLKELTFRGYVENIDGLLSNTTLETVRFSDGVGHLFLQNNPRLSAVSVTGDIESLYINDLGLKDNLYSGLTISGSIYNLDANSVSVDLTEAEFDYICRKCINIHPNAFNSSNGFCGIFNVNYNYNGGDGTSYVYRCYVASRVIKADICSIALSHSGNYTIPDKLNMNNGNVISVGSLGLSFDYPYYANSNSQFDIVLTIGPNITYISEYINDILGSPRVSSICLDQGLKYSSGSICGYPCILLNEADCTKLIAVFNSSSGNSSFSFPDYVTGGILNIEHLDNVTEFDTNNLNDMYGLSLPNSVTSLIINHRIGTDQYGMLFIPSSIKFIKTVDNPYFIAQDNVLYCSDTRCDVDPYLMELDTSTSLQLYYVHSSRIGDEYIIPSSVQINGRDVPITSVVESLLRNVKVLHTSNIGHVNLGWFEALETLYIGPGLGNLEIPERTHMLDVHIENSDRFAIIDDVLYCAPRSPDANLSDNDCKIIRYLGSVHKDRLNVPDQIMINGKSHNVAYICSYAFYNANISVIQIPDSVYSIGSSVFTGSEIKEVILPDGDFYWCNWLEDNCAEFNIHTVSPGKIYTDAGIAYYEHDGKREIIGIFDVHGVLKLSENDYIDEIYISNSWDLKAIILSDSHSCNIINSNVLIVSPYINNNANVSAPGPVLYYDLTEDYKVDVAAMTSGATDGLKFTASSDFCESYNITFNDTVLENGGFIPFDELSGTSSVYHICMDYRKYEYNVIFDMRSDALPNQTVSVFANEPVQVPENPERGGLLFGGWYSDEGCTVRYDFSAPIIEDTVIYAGWGVLVQLKIIKELEGSLYIDGTPVYENIMHVVEGVHTVSFEPYDFDPGHEILFNGIPVTGSVNITADSQISVNLTGFNVTVPEGPSYIIDGIKVSGNVFRLSSGMHIIDFTCSDRDSLSLSCNSGILLNRIFVEHDMVLTMTQVRNFPIDLPEGIQINVDGDLTEGRSWRVIEGWHRFWCDASERGTIMMEGKPLNEQTLYVNHGLEVSLIGCPDIKVTFEGDAFFSMDWDDVENGIPVHVPSGEHIISFEPIVTDTTYVLTVNGVKYYDCIGNELCNVMLTEDSVISMSPLDSFSVTFPGGQGIYLDGTYFNGGIHSFREGYYPIEVDYGHYLTVNGVIITDRLLVDRDLTLVSHIGFADPDRILITFINDDSKGELSRTEFDFVRGDVRKLPEPRLVMPGYRFIGWTSNSQVYHDTSDIVENMQLYAGYVRDPREVEISFVIDENKMEGVPLSPVKVHDWTVFDLPVLIPALGCEFTGWSVDGRIVPGDSYMIMDDTVFVAEFSGEPVPKYDVHFAVDPDAGSVKESAMKVYKGTELALPELTIREGYEFDGWFIKDIAVPDGYTVESEITVEARFTKLVILQFSAETSMINGSVPEDILIRPNSVVLLPSVEPVLGYRFAGWYLGEEHVDDSYTAVLDVTLNARFEQIVYSITFDCGTECATEPLPEVMTGTYGQVLSLPTVEGKVGFKFLGWSLNGELIADNMYAIADSVTLCAEYDGREYDVTVSFDPAECSYDGTTSNKLRYKETLTLGTLIPKEGYAFRGWLVNGEPLDGMVVTVEGATMIVPDMFQIYTVELSVDADKGVLSCESKQHVEVGQEFVPDDPAVKDGYIFIRWADENGRTVDSDNPVCGACRLTAEFKNIWDVTLIVDGEKGALIGDDRLSIIDGDTITPEVSVMAEGYYFAGWASDGSIPVKTVKVSSDVVLTAVFKLQILSVTFEAGDHGSITGEHLSETEYGSTIVIPEVTVDKGYRFVSWSDLDGSKFQPLYEVRITKDTVFTAAYEKQVYRISMSAATEESGYLGEQRDIEYLGKLTLPVLEPNRGYEFKGWTSNGSDIIKGEYTVTGTAVLTPVFIQLEKFIITYQAQDGLTISKSDDLYYAGEALELPEIISVKGGYRFDGWYSDGNLVSDGAEPSSDMTIVARSIDISPKEGTFYNTDGSITVVTKVSDASYSSVTTWIDVEDREIKKVEAILNINSEIQGYTVTETEWTLTESGNTVREVNTEVKDRDGNTLSERTEIIAESNGIKTSIVTKKTGEEDDDDDDDGEFDMDDYDDFDDFDEEDEDEEDTPTPGKVMSIIRVEHDYGKTATVDKDMIKTALGQIKDVMEELGTDAVIDVETRGSEKHASVSLSADSLLEICDNGADLRVSGAVGTIILDKNASRKLGGYGGDVSLSISHADRSTLTESQLSRVGDRVVYQLQASAGGENVHELEGNVIVTLPYELRDGDNPNAILVYYVDNDGNMYSHMTKYDSVRHTVSFKTNHFSCYMIGVEGMDVPEDTSFTISPMVLIGAGIAVAVIAGLVLVLVRRR